MVAPAIALAIAAFIGGHPSAIVCDVPETAIVTAWTTPAAPPTIHLRASLCAALAEPPAVEGWFPVALGALIHESAHQRGISDEACAEKWGDLMIFGVLTRFYGEPFLSPLSLEIESMAQLNTSRLPAEYHWTVFTCSLADEPVNNTVFWPWP